jgi:hypothetical protein
LEDDMARVRQRLTMVSSFLCLGFLLGCSANSGAGTSSSPSTGSGGDMGQAGAGGSAGTQQAGTGNTTSSSGGDTTGFHPGMNMSSGGGGSDAGCAATSASAEQTTVTTTTRSPVAISLVQDRSGSMTDTPPGASSNKWTQTTTADNAFVNDPNSAGLDVALTLFPNGQQPAGDCTGTGYMTPIVPLGRLPSQQQAQAVTSALAGNAPGGRNTGQGTPIEAALRGGEDYCLQFEANNPAEPCVVVLITDGAPNGCSNDQTVLSGIASSAKQQATSSGGTILTFTIGMNGADFNLLNAIAVAGGGNCAPGTTGMEACNVDTGGTSLIDALNLIRTTVTKTQVVTKALPCEYGIPDPGAGNTFDRDKVNVQYVDGSNTTEFLRVNDAASCAANGNAGWYYDNPTSPSKVELCPGTCTQVSGSIDAGAPPSGTAPRVNVLFGCSTDIAGPS